ncbi:MAG: hypothetical protein HY290_20500 [Planctomycetia bacterium]|nr:hypothetical protein [Planctomycetia bacterium]
MASAAVSIGPFLRADDTPAKSKRIAAVVTEYRHNSHADVIVSRLFQTLTLDGTGSSPRMQLVSVYTDQVPERDTSRKWASQYQFRIADNVADALTLGTGELAVDGVLLVAEHGKYPHSDTGQTQYPKRRLFTEVSKVFRESKKTVPVFLDKHLADNWDDAKFIYDTARELKIPLMAGSSLPSAWRDPPADVRRDAKLKQIVGFSYGGLDSYGFHGMEMLQVLAERRNGGETGIRSVECLAGKAVWEAAARGVYDPALFDAALARMKPVPATREKLPDLVPEPVLFVVDYADGLRANLFTLNGAISEWAAAWRYDDGAIESTKFGVQEGRPFMHFAWQVTGIDEMMQTGKPAWPVERTLLTSGALDALLISKRDAGRRVETPYLAITYRDTWTWKQPPDPPPARPDDGQ